MTSNIIADAKTPLALQNQPSHPGYFHILRQDSSESFSSKLIADRDFPKDSVVASLEGYVVSEKLYSTVQVSTTEHIELSSDLAYLNHSCQPTVYVDVEQRLVKALSDIKVGDELTFFYPSTEWEMAQPFQCWCGAPNCIRTVEGAHQIPADILGQFKLSKHIRSLVENS
ncbi:hypothetical protein BDF14DRAFT_1983174 [Spinellus fusiger]|nr:hypothetical protein BDF14DRAFT_1983174 [Spinellus fusiger]